VAAVIGDPVRHSWSPAIFDAGFEAAGLDWTYVAFEVSPASLADALAGARALGLAGLNVTTPHKDAVAALVDELSPRAAALRAVNCVTVVDGRLLGDNTDGQGFVDALGWAEVAVVGRRIAVLGAGGAARAIVAALGEHGAADVAVVNRTAERAVAAAALAGPAGRAGTTADLERADLVVNATSVGFGDPDALPVEPELIRPEHVVVDVVYHPLHTALLREAQRRGARTVDGLGMLVGQAAVAFERWCGVAAPVEAMRRAAESQLAR
jgi:shikimate dehydrogenase